MEFAELDTALYGEHLSLAAANADEPLSLYRKWVAEMKAREENAR